MRSSSVRFRFPGENGGHWAEYRLAPQVNEAEYHGLKPFVWVLRSSPEGMTIGGVARVACNPFAGSP